ncbi:hypothetical protein MRX96_010509 [Rhipicephalus microplus]
MRRERIVLERCLPPTRLPDDDLRNGEALERNIRERIENETRKRLNHVQAAAVVVEAAPCIRSTPQTGCQPDAGPRN